MPEKSDMNRRGRLPDFLVVGAVKCGTTSLHHYLSHHPEVWMARPKELRFFFGSERQDALDPPGANWWRGEEWYRSHFHTVRPVCGEISPQYVDATWGERIAERLHAMVPNIRLILLVREPMERLRSHYLMWRRKPESGVVTFEEFVGNGRFEDFVAYSDYGSQISRLLGRFPRASLLVVESADLDRQRNHTLAKIFAFLGVDTDFRSSVFARKLHERKRRRFPSTFGELIAYSPPMRIAKSILPFTAHEILRNIVLAPFSRPEPDLTLPGSVEARLRARFRHQAELARRLTGLPLASLGT